MNDKNYWGDVFTQYNISLPVKGVVTKCRFKDEKTGVYMVSGLTRNVGVGPDLNCMTQCLSNRPNGCA